MAAAMAAAVEAPPAQTAAHQQPPVHAAPALPHGCRWHVFLSHAQASGGLQCMLLREALEVACPSLRVWFDQVRAACAVFAPKAQLTTLMALG